MDSIYNALNKGVRLTENIRYIEKSSGDYLIMDETKLKKVKYSYTMTAVVFGADETLLNIELVNDFKFVKRSLMPLVDHLDTVFETDAMGLRRDYETAVVNKNRLEVICVEKNVLFELESNEAYQTFHQYSVNDFASIDDQIRTIRFLNEGALRLKKIAVKMSSDEAKVDGVNTASHYNTIFPISESYVSKPLALLHLDDDAILKTNFQIKRNLIPLLDTSLNICHAYYDLSYFNETYVSIVLLITALEMIFLKGEQRKKIFYQKEVRFIFMMMKNKCFLIMKILNEFTRNEAILFTMENIKILLRMILFF